MIIIVDLVIVAIVALVGYLLLGEGAHSMMEAAASAPKYTMTLFVVLIVLELALHIFLLIHSLRATSKAKKPLKDRMFITGILFIGFLCELFRCLVIAITICEGVGSINPHPTSFFGTLLAPLQFFMNIIIWPSLAVVGEFPRYYQLKSIISNPCAKENQTKYLAIGIANSAGLFIIVFCFFHLLLNESLPSIIYNLFSSVL